MFYLFPFISRREKITETVGSCSDSFGVSYPSIAFVYRHLGAANPATQVPRDGSAAHRAAKP
jgi:hypothetical protein